MHSLTRQHCAKLSLLVLDLLHDNISQGPSCGWVLAHEYTYGSFLLLINFNRFIASLLVVLETRSSNTSVTITPHYTTPGTTERTLTSGYKSWTPQYLLVACVLTLQGPQQWPLPLNDSF